MKPTIIEGKGNFINGTWIKGSGKSFQSKDPSLGMPVWHGESASTMDVSYAVMSAKKTFELWSSLNVEERIMYLKNFGEILKSNKTEIHTAISKETGKPLWDSANEVESMISKIPISIEAFNKRCGELYKDMSHGKSVTRHRPHGVAAILGPFNFPGHLPNGHIIPALLAGNTLVFKPSEFTPRVAELMMDYWSQAGLPSGTLNMVQGSHEVGAALAQHPDINALFFTGSARTGMILSEIYGNHPEKILALEMGGNNPLIVSQINDVKKAALITILSSFLSSGQRCTCARRLIVVESKVGDAFIHELKEMVSTLQIGSYTDFPEPFMGPVISEASALHLLDKQDQWLSSKASAIVRMKLLKIGTGLVSPGLIDVTAMKERIDEEIFGPLLQLIRVPSFDIALEEANRTCYGLSAGLLSESKEEYEKFIRKIKAGVISWNAQMTGASSAAPFGGIGCSGNHRPSAFYAADYCSYPIASIESEIMHMPSQLPPGIKMI